MCIGGGHRWGAPVSGGSGLGLFSVFWGGWTGWALSRSFGSLAFVSVLLSCGIGLIAVFGLGC